MQLCTSDGESGANDEKWCQVLHIKVTMLTGILPGCTSLHMVFTEEMTQSCSVVMQRKITVMRPKTPSSILPPTPCPCSSDQITPMRTDSQASRHFFPPKVMETMDLQHDCLSHGMIVPSIAVTSCCKE
ncbi:hypothetical protein cypCar_00024165 [Cyprinus carpio]|nr:hypothetical protein cypCar_00024165 [Cyprinus carpio]